MLSWGTDTSQSIVQVAFNNKQQRSNNVLALAMARTQAANHFAHYIAPKVSFAAVYKKALRHKFINSISNIAIFLKHFRQRRVFTRRCQHTAPQYYSEPNNLMKSSPLCDEYRTLERHRAQHTEKRLEHVHGRSFHKGRCFRPSSRWAGRLKQTIKIQPVFS